MTTSTPSSALSLLPTPTHLPVVHNLVTIKLTRDNYLLWKAQIVPYLRGQHLFGFLDNSRLAPPQHLLLPIHLIPWLPIQKTSSPNRKFTRMAKSDTLCPRRSSPLLTALSPSQNPRATPWLPRAVNGVKP